MTTQEMDRLAATEVMRWRVEIINEDGTVSAYRDDLFRLRLAEDFQPSTNEEYSEMVRDKMASDGWLVSACVDDGEWSASLWRQGSRSFVVTRDKPMMPYCLTAAALLAVGAVKEEDI